MALPVMNSDVVDSKLRQLLGIERNTKVDFLLHLDLFERLDGFEKLGYATLWDYCRRELGIGPRPCNCCESIRRWSRCFEMAGCLRPRS